MNELIDLPSLSIPEEELDIILGEMAELGMDGWEMEFIMDIAERNWLSSKQGAKISDIYRKYIDSNGGEL